MVHASLGDKLLYKLSKKEKPFKINVKILIHLPLHNFSKADLIQHDVSIYFFIHVIKNVSTDI